MAKAVDTISNDTAAYLYQMITLAIAILLDERIEYEDRHYGDGDQAVLEASPSAPPKYAHLWTADGSATHGSVTRGDQGRRAVL